MFDDNRLYVKKAISPVVAVALLLVVAVIAVVGFQSWFSTYLSGDFVKIEGQTSDSSGSDIRMEKIIDNVLWVINDIADNYTIDKLEIDGNVCNNVSNLSLGLNPIDVSDCIVNITSSSPSVVMYTGDKISEKYFYVKDAVIDSDNGVSGMSTSLSCTTDVDVDGQILWTCALYPMTNTTFEGRLDVNDGNVTIVDDGCWLKDDKSSCVNNFIIDGCGVGTVLDKGTGLCWQRNMSSFYDYDGTTLNWTDAKNYCSGLSLGGHSNWNLPTKEELMSLTDLSRSSPAIVGGNNNKFQNVVNNLYWTVSTYHAAGNAWIVNLYGGGGYFNDKSSSYYVTCVVRN